MCVFVAEQSVENNGVVKSEGPFCFSILDATPWEPFGPVDPHYLSGMRAGPRALSRQRLYNGTRPVYEKKKNSC